MRDDELGRELLADQELDLGGGERGLDRILLLVGLVGRFLLLRSFGGGRPAARLERDDVGERAHRGGEHHEGEHRQAGHQRQHEEQHGRDIERARIGAELAEHGLVGRAARAALGHQQAGGEGHDERRDLGDQAVADRQLDEHVGGFAEVHAVAEIADRDAADDVDEGDDQAGDGVAADEFRGAVHRAEEGRFLLQLAAAKLRGLVVDDAGRKVGVDRHLLAGNGVEGEARADLGDTGRALGDDDEVHDDQDHEHDEADDEVARHHQVREAGNDVAGGVRALVAVRQDHAGRRDVERQAQHGGDQEDGREGREIERPRDPQRDHQDQHRERDREGEADVDQEGRDRQEKHRQDDDDAEREEDVAAIFGHGFGADCLCDCHVRPNPDAARASAGAVRLGVQACARVGRLSFLPGRRRGAEPSLRRRGGEGEFRAASTFPRSFASSPPSVSTLRVSPPLPRSTGAGTILSLAKWVRDVEAKPRRRGFFGHASSSPRPAFAVWPLSPSARFAHAQDEGGKRWEAGHGADAS